MTDHRAVYDDAELLAIQIIRDAAAEWSASPDYSLSQLINDHLLGFQAQHGTDGAVAGLVVALARFAAVSLIGKTGSSANAAAFLDDFELHKIEQHQYEKDHPGDV